MPTARELLEQADALMRRDREALAGGERARPSSTPITLAPRQLAGAAVSPRTIQHEPIAPSVARTSLPVHPTDSPAFAVPDATPFTAMPGGASTPATPETAPVQGEPAPGSIRPEQPVSAPRSFDDVAPVADADFPMLTDAVVDVVEIEEPGLASGGEDVPLLTDAVEPLDVVEVLEPDRGEPSAWDAAVRDASALGRAPDSVAVVSPLDRLPVAPPTARDPLGLDRPAPGFAAPPSLVVADWSERPAQAVIETAAESQEHDAATPEGAAASPSSTEAPAEPRPVFEASFSLQPSPVAAPTEAVEPQGPAAAPPWHGESGEGTVAGSGALAGFAPLRPQPGYAPVSAPDLRDAGTPPTSAAFAEAGSAPVAPAPAAASHAAEAPTAEPAPPALDDARIAEAVDEIRMQVLQRIDIFTDTTLRAKLGEHLQPLVERASADLVAAINQHVGDLLRAYVAEALEQEIERWRSGQR